ncbi:MAG: CoA-transferase subunit beta, partial [Myxococcota bacterium]
MTPATASERMTIAAARELTSQDVCFVGIGAPSEACNLARLTHAPDITLIYESGTLRTRPGVLPLSIGDGELSKTALTNVSVPEMFRYWLQGGHISVGFLGGAQIDRFANLNSTVIGDYDAPHVRLPGAGGAPEIASHCGRILVVMRQVKRAFVPRVDFVTSYGFGAGGREREQLGLTTQGMQRVITDLCVLEPGPETRELEVVALHPGVTLDQVREHTAWELRVRDG